MSEDIKEHFRRISMIQEGWCILTQVLYPFGWSHNPVEYSHSEGLPASLVSACFRFVQGSWSAGCAWRTHVCAAVVIRVQFGKSEILISPINFSYFGEPQLLPICLARSNETCMFFLGVSFTGLATRLEGGLATSFIASLAEISGSDPVVELRGR